MSVAIVTVAVDTTTQRLLLILAAVLVGAGVGLVGALIFGVVTGVRATPAAHTGGPDVGAAPAARRPISTAAEPVGPPAASPFAAPRIGSVPALFAVDSDVVRDRHRELYDAEYVKQLDRVDALRRRSEPASPSPASRPAFGPTRRSSTHERNRPVPVKRCLLVLSSVAAVAASAAPAGAQAPAGLAWSAAGERRRSAGASGDRPGVCPPGTPAAVPGAITGPGLLSGSSVALNRAKRTFSIAWPARRTARCRSLRRL